MARKPLILFLCTGILFLATSALAQGPIYRYVDAQGHIQYTDRPEHDGFVRIVHTWKGWIEAKPFTDFVANKRKFLPMITAAADQNRLPRELIVAVIHAESHFNPHSVSRSGAVGLMQLMPETARRFGVSDRHNPRQNIQAGVRYLRKLMTLYAEDLDLTLAAYNAGENTVKRFGNQIPPYPETRNYIQKVRQLYRQYRQQKL